MYLCQECGGPTWLMFQERLVCATCGAQWLPAAQEAVAEVAAAEVDPRTYVYFQAASNGRVNAYTYREGGKMERVPVKVAEQMLEDGRAEQTLNHPTKQTLHPAKP